MHDRQISRVALPEAAIGVGMLAFAAVVLWQTWTFPVSPLYAKIGPTLFAYITAAGLAVLALLLVVQAARGGWQPEEEKEVPLDRRALGFVAAGLLVNAATITYLGFILASTMLFVLVAHGFGSRKPWWDALIGFAVAVMAYFGFAKALGVNIGGGLFENMLGV
jgi:putative tricarboxylic transport membrane protein